VEPFRTREDLVTAVQAKSIFSQVDIILKYNLLLYTDLQKRMEEGRDSKIADIFLRFTDFLKIYTVYVNNYTTAFSTIRECMKNPKFSLFIEVKSSYLLYLLV
jgi:hypothetical protein